MKQYVKVPFGQIYSSWVGAKWVPKLWILSKKSKNFDKKRTQTRVSQIRVSQIRVTQIRASQIWVTQIRATEISSNHRELHGTIFIRSTSMKHSRQKIYIKCSHSTRIHLSKVVITMYCTLPPSLHICTESVKVHQYKTFDVQFGSVCGFLFKIMLK